MFKKLWFIHHAIMLNICVVLSKQCLIILKGYVIMLRNPVILFMKHVNLSVNAIMLDKRSYKIKWGYPTSWLEIGV